MAAAVKPRTHTLSTLTKRSENRDPLFRPRKIGALVLEKNTYFEFFVEFILFFIFRKPNSGTRKAANMYPSARLPTSGVALNFQLSNVHSHNYSKHKSHLKLSLNLESMWYIVCSHSYDQEVSLSVFCHRPQPMAITRTQMALVRGLHFQLRVRDIDLKLTL